MKTRNLVWLTAVILSLAGTLSFLPAADKDEAKSTTITAAARQVWAITDLVLEQDIDPPARQQMLLHGIKSLLRQNKAKDPANLAERVSHVTTQEQFAALLAEVWPQEASQSETGFTDPREFALFNGLLAWRMSREDGPFYFSPKEAKRQAMIAGNRYVGTGIQIRINDKEKLTQIVIPFPGGPARKAGARPGDLIVEVDGKSMEGVTLSKVVERLQGEEGTNVSMKVRQPGENQTRFLPMVRSVIPFTSVHGYRRTGEESWSFSVEPGSAIGYLSFDEIKISTLLELRKIEPMLHSEGMKALILDLRFSRGDELRYAAQVADGLLDGGILCRVRDSHGRTKEYKADRDCLFRDIPVAVLIGEHTGSIAAIFAAVLQDRDRAILVGEVPKTELMVTSLVQLPEDQGAVVLRTGRLERKERPQSKKQERLAAVENRLVPDHPIGIEAKEMGDVYEWMQKQASPEPKADAKPPSDPQLKKAIALLQKALEKSEKKDSK